MKELETNNLVLRKFKLTDAKKAYENWAGVSEIAKLSDFKVHANVEETKAIIKMGSGEEGEDMYIYGIFLKNTNEPVGFVRIYQVSAINKTCKIYFTVGKKWFNKGISNEAIKRVLEDLFEDKGYNVVICEYYSNVDYLFKRILESVGMYKEAVLRQRKISEVGNMQDKIIYSITKQEYESLVKC